jgi:LuxR family maltose regulon positive regulatory protein
MTFSTDDKNRVGLGTAGISAKLMPLLAGELVERKCLIDCMAPLPSKRLALIVAGAGYGKTTLAAQALKNLGMQSAWYCLDAYDQDFNTFFVYVISSIRKWHADFGASLLQRLAGDDFHLVHQCAEITESVEFFLSRLPAKVHLVIISRVLPDLRLSNHRAARALIDIGEGELAFNRSEVEDLCRLTIPMVPDPAAIDALHARTGGWVAALVLSCAEFVKKRDESSSPVHCLSASGDLLHQYIAENVFEAQPAFVQAFMLETSLLNYLDPTLCDRLRNKTDSLEILTYLTRSHLLTFTFGFSGHRPCYRYHHLLQVFLQERLHRLRGETGVSELHQKTGTLYEALKDHQNALIHYVAAQAHDRICRLVAGMDISHLNQCPLTLLAQALDALPIKKLRQYPLVMHIKARFDSLRGDLGGAVQGLKEALASFEKSGHVPGMTRCRRDLAFHSYLMGDVKTAYEKAQALWHTLEMDGWFYAETGGYLIFFASLLGRFDQADAFRDAALTRIPNTMDSRALIGRLWIGFCNSIRYQYAGDFETSEILAVRLLGQLAEIGADLMLPIAYFHAALNAFYLHRPERGVRHAEEGLRIAERLGISDHQHAWLLYARGSNNLLAGDIPNALRDAHEALECMQVLGNPWGCSSGFELLGRVSICRADPVVAEQWMRKSLDSVAESGLVIWHGQVLLGLAETLIAQGRLEDAFEIIGNHELELKSSTFNLFRSQLLAAVIHLSNGAQDRSAESLCRALALAGRYRYEAWAALWIRGLTPVHDCCRTRGLDESYLSNLLERADKLPDTLPAGCLVPARKAPTRSGPFASAADSPVGLKVSFLGGFRVTTGQRKIGPEKWKNTKAAMIFQYLALNPHKGFVPKDVLLELVWPDQDPAVTRKRFHVALHFLRRLLEPDLKRGQSSSYLLRRGDAYRLETGMDGQVDALCFAQALEQAQRHERSDESQALNCFLEAETLFRGELLPGEGDCQWLVDQRQMYQRMYLKCLTKIIYFLEHDEKWAQCAQYAEKYLALEAYSEPVYRTLMRCRAGLGDISGVLDAFERCGANIIHDLGFPLSRETLELYEELTDGSGRPL